MPDEVHVSHILILFAVRSHDYQWVSDIKSVIDLLSCPHTQQFVSDIWLCNFSVLSHDHQEVSYITQFMTGSHIPHWMWNSEWVMISSIQAISCSIIYRQWVAQTFYLPLPSHHTYYTQQVGDSDIMFLWPIRFDPTNNRKLVGYFCLWEGLIKCFVENRGCVTSLSLCHSNDPHQILLYKNRQ